MYAPSNSAPRISCQRDTSWRANSIAATLARSSASAWVIEDNGSICASSDLAGRSSVSPVPSERMVRAFWFSGEAAVNFDHSSIQRFARGLRSELGGEEGYGGEHNQVNRDGPGGAAAPGHESRRSKGCESPYRRSDLEAERGATVTQTRCEQLGIPRGADREPDHLTESDRRDDRQRNRQLILRVEQPEHREGECHREQTAGIEHRLPADPVGKPAENWDRQERHGRSEKDGVDDHIPWQAEIAGDIADGENAGDNRITDLGNLEPDGREEWATMPRQDFHQRQLGYLFPGLDLAEDRRFFELQADIKADADKNDTDQERNAPSPGQKIGLWHLRQRRKYPDCGEIADRPTDLNHRPEKPAVSGRRILDNHEHGSAPFAAKADTLKQTQTN